MKYLLTCLCTVMFLSIPLPAFASKSYEAPTLSSSPREPDVIQNEGATVRLAPWVLTVSPYTFTYDVFFQHGCSDKSFPRNLGSYWQISNICEFHPRSQFNGARAVAQHSWIITYEYTDEELEFFPGLRFPENSLKIVFSPDHGNSWEMLKSSTVDPINNTVAAITDKPGGYMLMGGFVNPRTYYSYKEVKGATTTRFSLVSWLIDSIQKLF